MGIADRQVGGGGGRTLSTVPDGSNAKVKHSNPIEEHLAAQIDGKQTKRQNYHVNRRATRMGLETQKF